MAAAGKALTKHWIGVPRISVCGEKALAETDVVIMNRSSVGPVEIDVTSFARFFDRLQCDTSRDWKILSRVAIYVHILKLETWLLAPRSGVGLESENTTLNYSPTLPAGMMNVLWLPHEVTVQVHYHDVFIRNTHRYSGFKLFQSHAVIEP